ncbi:MAG: hypothetical protein K0V04_04680 [Deltaproteobacteria bacterium]|nr:hypothetical protein [Deltaproteobacteria bacterium]
MIEPDLFSTIELDTRDRSTGSPSALVGWLGLLLRAPSRVTIDVDENGDPTAPVVIPVCGFHRLDVPSPPVDDPEMLVIRRKADNKEFRGPVVTTDPSSMEPPPDEPPPSAADLAGMTVDTYFNADLYALVELPLQSGEYEVWFEFRGKRSNKESLELQLVP